MNKRFRQALVGALIGIPLASYLSGEGKPKWLEYLPHPLEWNLASGSEYRGWTQFIRHGKITSLGDGYETHLLDLDTGRLYLVGLDLSESGGKLLVGEYFDLQIVKGQVKSGTRVREPFPCAQLDSVSEVPSNYSLAHCVLKETKLPSD